MWIGTPGCVPSKDKKTWLTKPGFFLEVLLPHLIVITVITVAVSVSVEVEGKIELRYLVLRIAKESARSARVGDFVKAIVVTNPKLCRFSKIESNSTYQTVIPVVKVVAINRIEFIV